MCYKKVIVAEGAKLNGHGRRLLEQAGAQTMAEYQAPLRIAEVIQKPPALEFIAVKWSLLPGCINALLLEPVRKRDGSFTCQFMRATALPDGHSLELFFADAVAELTFNGSPARLSKCENGMIGRPMQSESKPVNTLRFRCVEDVNSPFVWLHGEFRVVSRAPFTPGQDGTVATAGPFVLTAIDGAVAGDLIQAGFPFLRSPLVVETRFKTIARAKLLRLDDMKADAGRVTLDGRDLGWIWGSCSEIAAPVKPGTHTLRLKLIPSTFNYFGPHHYFAGDRHVVSPDQFAGRKNFADPGDAPANTLVASWQFRQFRLPERISLL